MSTNTNSGIRDKGDGTSYIPSSRRADGSTRKEIRVRPGYTPQEDVKTYKSRNAEAFRTGGGGVPGADNALKAEEAGEAKSKNAKRREASKRKQAAEQQEQPMINSDGGLVNSMDKIQIAATENPQGGLQDHNTAGNHTILESEEDIERQKKIRNYIKKLKAVRELKDKKSAGQKLSPDQLVKMSKEDELLRDLKKLGCNDRDLDLNGVEATSMQDTNGG